MSYSQVCMYRIFKVALSTLKRKLAKASADFRYLGNLLPSNPSFYFAL